MELDKNQTITLEVDVNCFQRDQYETDGTTAMTDEKNGPLVRIQGDKSHLEGAALKGALWPIVKVMRTNIWLSTMLWSFSSV